MTPVDTTEMWRQLIASDDRRRAEDLARRPRLIHHAGGWAVEAEAAELAADRVLIVDGPSGPHGQAYLVRVGGPTVPAAAAGRRRMPITASTAVIPPLP